MTSTAVTQHDVASLGRIRRLSARASGTAGGAGDNTLVTGATIDRMSGGSFAGSAVFALVGETTLAAAATLSLAYTIKHSPDGSAWATYATGANAVISTGATGGSTNLIEQEIPVDLNSAYRFVRLEFIPDLSAANTDTFDLRAVAFLSGYDRLPQ
ncbi:hypothetical protein [Rhizobium oryzicola]|uniref:Discoidin domain-containing protein n=1 Tax=Rhizobium oryzicola TaxID=1232668 RepID=A0ABT8SWL3_9HYPH|nr:hypothetical protein [Rhizobium oryzicola]MDO1582423.1 hypothetical protein [Rhizobium oryzicola]